MASIYIARDNTRLGAFSDDEVRDGLRAGRFLSTDLGWREGMESWKPLAEFSELAGDAAITTAGAPPPLAQPARDVTSLPTASPYFSGGSPVASQPSRSMTKRITRISPVQFGIVLAAFYGALSLIIVPFILVASLVGAKASDSRGFLGAGIFVIIFLPLVYAVMGFIFGVIMAAIYNLIATWTGGVELTLDDPS